LTITLSAGCHGSDWWGCRPGTCDCYVAPTRFETVPVDRRGSKVDAPVDVKPMTLVPDPPDIIPPSGGDSKKQISKNGPAAATPAKGSKPQGPVAPPPSGPVMPPNAPPASQPSALQSSTTKTPGALPLPTLAMQVKGPATDASSANGAVVSVTWPQKLQSPQQADQQNAAIFQTSPKAPLPEPPGPIIPTVQNAPAPPPALTLPLPPIAPVTVPEPEVPVLQPVVHTKPALSTPVQVPEPVIAQKPQPPAAPPRKLSNAIAVSVPYGHAADYSWISGEVEKWRNQWRLRYAPVDQIDQHGGCVTLAGEAFFSQLQDGENYKLQGRLVPANGRSGAPVFYIEAISPR